MKVHVIVLLLWPLSHPLCCVSFPRIGQLLSLPDYRQLTHFLYPTEGWEEFYNVGQGNFSQWVRESVSRSISSLKCHMGHLTADWCHDTPPVSGTQEHVKIERYWRDCVCWKCKKSGLITSINFYLRNALINRKARLQCYNAIIRFILIGS